VDKETLRKHGHFIAEKDAYDGTIYLYTSWIYYLDNAIYNITEHSNKSRYTGRNRTYIICEDVRKNLEEGYELYWQITEEEERKIVEIVQKEDSAKSKIKEMRINAGLSRAEMSRRLEIPVRTIEEWESGRRTPPVWAEKLIIEKLESMKDI